MKNLMVFTFMVVIGLSIFGGDTRPVKIKTITYDNFLMIDNSLNIVE